MASENQFVPFGNQIVPPKNQFVLRNQFVLPKNFRESNRPPENQFVLPKILRPFGNQFVVRESNGASRKSKSTPEKLFALPGINSPFGNQFTGPSMLQCTPGKHKALPKIKEHSRRILPKLQRTFEIQRRLLKISEYSRSSKSDSNVLYLLDFPGLKYLVWPCLLLIFLSPP